MPELSAEHKERILALLHDHRNLAVWDILSTYAFIALAFNLLLKYQHPAVQAGAFLLIGFMQYRLVMSCHEAVHETLAFPRALNEFFGVFHGALVGINFIRYRQQHMAHHKAKTVSQDSDGYIYYPLMRTSPGLPRAWAWIFGTLGEIIEKFRQKGLGREEDPAVNRMALWHSLALVLVNGALFLALWQALGWWGYFAFWLLPVLTIALFVNRTRVFIEHAYPHLQADGSFLEDPETPQKTVDLTSNFLESYLLAPFNFNYHKAHHHLPKIPHYDLPQLMEVLERGETGYGTRVRDTYLGLLWKMLKG